MNRRKWRRKFGVSWRVSRWWQRIGKRGRAKVRVANETNVKHSDKRGAFDVDEELAFDALSLLEEDYH